MIFKATAPEGWSTCICIKLTAQTYTHSSDSRPQGVHNVGSTTPSGPSKGMQVRCREVLADSRRLHAACMWHIGGGCVSGLLHSVPQQGCAACAGMPANATHCVRHAAAYTLSNRLARSEQSASASQSAGISNAPSPSNSICKHTASRLRARAAVVLLAAAPPKAGCCCGPND